MAIIVNKEEKRRAIALACSELLLEHGISDLTISQIAKTAGVGKGTIYEYFENKEDIVFEIITTYMSEYETELFEIIGETQTTKEKVFHFLSLLFSDENSKQLNLYREFLAISLTGGTEEMVAFSIGCKMRFASILEQIIDEAVTRGEIRAEAAKLINMILIFEKGIVVDSKVSALDAQKEIREFLDTLFELIEVKG
ncbi:MAG: TetR/AcrR family transcriptional regulator [Campylobacterota bacterium]|nr:TetR/AcrR family transcriptional regulator [Campylobacterota bacterium]